MRDHVFASATLDEVWMISSGGASLLSSRREKGRAVTRRVSEGFDIEAVDALEPEESAAVEHLIDHSGGIAGNLARDLPNRTRIHLVQRAQTIASPGARSTRAEQVVVLSSSPRYSVVCTPEGVEAVRSFLDRPEHALNDLEDGYRGYAIEWAAGSAAILMHEAVGHAAERGRNEVQWPGWLSVRDIPTEVLGDVDDCGQRTRESELTSTGATLPWRRSTFRDAPMQRMSSIVVSSRGLNAILPKERLCIRLLSGGRYDAVSDTVTIGVADAELLSGSLRVPLGPFTIREPRHAIARSLMGQCGAESRYPGVICIDEGQRVFVASRACSLLTRPFAEVW